ncbi:MAG TPA: hypothetical protein PLC64_04080 [Steroidobacteraceae bacterium]|nr:hypothetical protein [Steroidobacteraceae bacterium]HQX77874.1 hypothetical protein [Steroidobacteraceae bacterium]
MNREQILKMSPGEGLSLLVAEKIMGNVTTRDEFMGFMERMIDPADGGSVWVPLTAYSEDIGAAEEVVERMLGKGHPDAIYWSQFGEGKYAEAEAICKAAMLALEEAPEGRQQG